MRSAPSTMPSTAAVRDDGRLSIGGCDALELAREFGTPVYVIDESDIRLHARTYLEAFASRDQRAEVVYASKALPVAAVLNVVSEEGLSCEATTSGELTLALRSGFPPPRLLLHGNARSEAELKMALDAGVGRIVIDSFDDIDRLERLAARPQRVLLRVQPGIRPDTHASQATGHLGSKFGLAPGQARLAIERLRRSSAFELEGLHAHIGSQILDLESFRATVERVADLGDFPVYDFGGGLGVTYRKHDEAPTIDAYVDALVGAVRKSLGSDKLILVEPGRSLFARACVTLYSVMTVKRDGVTHVAVDGGTSDNLEAIIGMVGFEACVADRLDGSEECIVVGKHCDSGDVIVATARRSAPAIGDVIAVPATGAYGYGMANNYNCVPRPPVIVCREGSARIAVRRETFGDLFSRDLDLQRSAEGMRQDAPV
jgi:diaminopimelate decarboxylase